MNVASPQIGQRNPGYRHNILRAFLLLGACVLYPPSPAHACSDPVGTEGEIVYNSTHHVAQFCDGTNWISMAGGDSGPGSAGSNRQVIFNNSGALAGAARLIWDAADESLAIGKTSPAASSSLVELVSTSKGFLPPRMTTVQMSAIPAPAEGLVAYDSDAHALKIYNGSGWSIVGGGTAFVDSVNVQSSSFSSTSACTTFVDLPGSTKAITVPAGTAMVDWSASSYSSSGALGLRYRFCLGGLCGGDQNFYTNEASSHKTYSGRWVTPITAGAINAKLQVCRTAGSGAITMDGNDGLSWKLTVIPNGGGISGGFGTLAGLGDVDVSGAATGKALVYNSATAKWEAVALAGGGGLSADWGFKEGPLAFVSAYTNSWDHGGGSGASIDCTSNANGCSISEAGTYEVFCLQRSNGTASANPYIGVALNGNRSALEGRADAMWAHDHMAPQYSHTNSHFLGTLSAGDFITCGPPAAATADQLMYSAQGYAGIISIKRIDVTGGGGKFVDGDNPLDAVYTLGKIGIGTTAPEKPLHVLTIDSVRGIVNEQVTEDSLAALIVQQKARGTPSARTALFAGDVLSNLQSQGYDGTAFGSATRIRSIAEQDFTSTNRDTSITFDTVSGISMTEKMRITGAGSVGIGTTTPQSLLHVTGGVQLGDDAADCPGSSDEKLGTLRFNSGNLQLCTSSGWGAISAGGGGGASGQVAGVSGGNTGAPQDVWTTLDISSASPDPSSIVDASTDRITPTTAGYYYVSAAVQPISAIADGTRLCVAIAVNGSHASEHCAHPARLSDDFHAWGHTLVYLDGDDYVQFRGFQRDAGTKNLRLTAGTLVPASAGGGAGGKFVDGDDPDDAVYTAGNVGIGTATPSASALLEVFSTSQGFLPPRMDETQRDAIDSPATGLMIFNTTALQYQFWTGAAWSGLGGGVPAGTIAAFSSSTCPAGWTEYVVARGRFLRGIDNGAGNDPDGTRAPGSAQADALGSHSHTVVNGNNKNLTINHGGSTAAADHVAATVTEFAEEVRKTGSPGSRIYTNVEGDAETRPKNVAVIFCQYTGAGGSGSGGTGGKFVDGADPNDAVYLAGNVGIGTTTPATSLDVTGTIQADVFGARNASGTFFLVRETTTDGMPANDGVRLMYEGEVFGTNKDALIFEKTDFNNPVVDGGILFANRGSDNVRVPSVAIMGTGNVGIGTMSPDTTLDVAGQIRGKPDVYRIGGTISSSGQCYACTAGDTLISATQTSLDNCSDDPCDVDMAIDIPNNRVCAGSNDDTGWAAFGICMRASQ